MRKLSIKKKIMLWFTAALLILALGTSLFTLYISRNVLNQSIQERLINLVTSNAGEIEYYNSLSEHEQEPSDFFLSYNGGILEIDDDFFDYYDGICTALIDSNNSLLYGEVPFTLSDRDAFSFTSVGTVTNDGQTYYIYEKKLQGDNLDGLWLRGFVSEYESTHILYTVARMSLWIVPLFALAALIGGYAITRRSFLPVEKISDAAEEISASGDLSRRIDLGEGRDELHQLAVSFNRMFDRLEANFNAEKQFTSDASHELRTPMAVIQAQCEYALGFAKTEEEYRDALKVIQRQGKEVTTLLSQLLFFTRLEQGTEKYSFERTDLSGLVRSLCSDRLILLTREQSLEAEISDGIFIRGNSSLLCTLLANLLDNAYKYSGEKACVQVVLTEDEKSVRLSVKDNGIGISEENLSKIWNRFYRADSSRKSDESFGLGLSIVKEIADFHGGLVTAESRIGEGSVFTLKLPK